MPANQTEKESFAVATVGRKGVEEMLDKMGGEILSVASAQVQKMGPQWLQRSMLYVVNTPALSEVVQSKTGIFSIYKCFLKASQMGIMLGGQFPHAHLVPYKDKNAGTVSAEIIVTADGYKHSAKHGQVPVIRDIRYGVVRSNDKVKIDDAAGEVIHEYDPLSDRGKIAGVWGVIEPVDGGPVARWMSYTDILAIRDTHSTKWKYDKSGPWRDDEEMMCIKTAAKRFLKPFAAEAEGLAMALSDGDDYDVPPPDSTPRNVTERAASHLDAAAKGFDPDPPVETKPAEKMEPANPEPVKNAQADAGDLF
jgi:phage RecT family recombinase